MILLIFISILNIISQFTHEIMAVVRKYFERESREITRLRQEVDNLKEELKRIPMQQEYTTYVRCERRMRNLEENIASMKEKDSMKVSSLLVKFALGYILSALFIIIFVFLSIFYRYEPILIFPEKIVFTPFTKFISFPTGIPGAVSVPFWIFINRYAFSSLKRIFW